MPRETRHTVAIGPQRPLRVAAVQAEPRPGDVAGNAALAARLVDRAAAEGAALAVLPELFLPAYHPPTLRDDPRTDVAADGYDRVIDGRLDPLRAAARDTGVVVVVGAAVRRADGRRTLSALVVPGTGEVIAAYDKQYLWGADEPVLFTPGSVGASLDLGGWRLALGICYDGCFPEHARAAALDGALIYLCPSAYLEGSQHRRDVYYAARALDNTMYVVFANEVGGAPPWRFNGGAAIYDPQGRTVARAANEGTAVIVSDIDPAELVATRTAHTMLTDCAPAERGAEPGGPRRVLALGPVPDQVLDQVPVMPREDCRGPDIVT